MKKRIKKRKTEVQLAEEMLKKEGFSRITFRESRSPEFRDSLKEFSFRRKKPETKPGKSL